MRDTFKKFVTVIKDREQLISALAARKVFAWMSGESYLRWTFHRKLGKPLNLKNPQTFNEKLQWLKLYDRRPEYTMMVDKYVVRQYIADTIGEEYLIPLLGVWDRVEDIDFGALPEQFVLKCTHDSGGLVICRDKSKLDVTAARAKLNKCMKRNYYWGGREWPYKNVKPRIIAERYMEDESEYELKDYKLFCFDGHVKVIQVDFGRFTAHKRNLYSPDWNYLGFASLYPTDPNIVIDRPDNLLEMITLAERIARGYPHMRVDLYSVNGKTLFGEITLHHGSGLERYTPPEWDYTLGSWLTLPEKRSE